MVEHWRLFVAVALTEEGRVRARTAQVAARDAGFTARWVEPIVAHLTLNFLGDTSSTRIDQLCGILRGVAAQHTPFSLRTGLLGAFPNPRHPRVLWLGLDGDLDLLSALHGAIDVALVLLGFPREGRAFRPI